MKYVLALLALVSFSLKAEIYHINKSLFRTEVNAKDKLETVEFYHDSKNFIAVDQKNNRVQLIPSHNLNKELRELKPEDLNGFSRGGYILVKQTEEGSLKLEARMPLKGGGPWLSLAVYLGVQVVGYTGLMTGAIAVNTLVPGAGNIATGLALGSGGIAGAGAAIQATALTWSTWAFALPTP